MTMIRAGFPRVRTEIIEFSPRFQLDITVIAVAKMVLSALMPFIIIVQSSPQFQRYVAGIAVGKMFLLALVPFFV